MARTLKKMIPTGRRVKPKVVHAGKGVRPKKVEREIDCIQLSMSEFFKFFEDIGETYSFSLDASDDYMVDVPTSEFPFAQLYFETPDGKLLPMDNAKVFVEMGVKRIRDYR